jgi:hypothetical protein
VVVVRIGRIGEEERIAGATVSAELQYRAGTVHGLRGRGPAARAVRGARNAGRGASPTAGKREGFSF